MATTDEWLFELERTFTTDYQNFRALQDRFKAACLFGEIPQEDAESISRQWDERLAKIVEAW